MNKIPNYYKNRVALNVLANSVDNAEKCYKSAEGHIVLGILTKNYHSDDEAISDMKRYQSRVDNAISVGLGAGDPNQSQMVSRVSKEIQPQHVNQVFTGVATTRAFLGQKDTVINGLISPTGHLGYVNIATGPLSSKTAAGEIPIATAIALLKDMGGTSVKYFPMGGLEHKEEFKEISKSCAENNFSLEPTGGINLDNFEEILKIAVNAGVKHIIPHVYSSIIDKNTGNTRPEDVTELYKIIQSVVK